MLRGLSDKLNSTNDNIKKANGTFVPSATERRHCWKDSSDGLFNHDPGPTTVPPEIDPHHSPMSDTEPTIKEVKHMNWKTPRQDHVAAEAIKTGGDILISRLHGLIRLIWRTEEIPEKAIVIPLHKKGHSCECKKYCEISLLSITGKITMKIIQLRLQKHCEQSSKEDQACFRPGRGCCNQIFILRQLII